jgi:hypothetical protein
MKEIDFSRNLLKYTFGIVPVVAGLDKFTNLLTNWGDYLHPAMAASIGAALFMKIVGVVEIIAGILVLWRTSMGALIVAAWLVLVALSLLASGKYLDVAVRDLVMAIAAYVLYNLTRAQEQPAAS